MSKKPMKTKTIIRDGKPYEFEVNDEDGWLSEQCADWSPDMEDIMHEVTNDDELLYEFLLDRGRCSISILRTRSGNLYELQCYRQTGRDTVTRIRPEDLKAEYRDKWCVPRSEIGAD
jgi:hypothetical protein